MGTWEWDVVESTEVEVLPEEPPAGAEVDTPETVQETGPVEVRTGVTPRSVGSVRGRRVPPGQGVGDDRTVERDPVPRPRRTCPPPGR